MPTNNNSTNHSNEEEIARLRRQVAQLQRTVDIPPLESIVRLERDMVSAVMSLSGQEARYLVDAYYTMQDYRKASANQRRALDASDEPHEIIDWYLKQCVAMEGQVARALEPYSMATLPGQWLRSIHGIGPVLAANFIAHLDVTRSRTAGGFWRFAGLDPTSKWGKGERRPFNAKLKVACWKATKSWVMLGEREDAYYAAAYRNRKEWEIERNESGGNKETALARAATVGKTTEARKHYETGVLPPAHVDARARRWTAKLFLAHLHHVMYECEYHEPPPKPYVIEHGGHGHYIGPPNWPLAAAV